MYVHTYVCENKSASMHEIQSINLFAYTLYIVHKVNLVKIYHKATQQYNRHH